MRPLCAALLRVPLVALFLAAGPAAADPDAACQPVQWASGPRQLAHLLGRPKVERDRKLIEGFKLEEVAPHPSAIGRGGITSPDLARALGECSDSPSGKFAKAGARHDDAQTGLRVEITQVEPAGKSGRRWPGVRCTYRISDPANPALFADLDDVPAFNQLTGLWREGTAVYAALQFNGYAREIRGHGNLVVALDLCGHKAGWRSRPLSANAALLLFRDYLITGYGFTKERSFLFVLSRWTGNPVQQIALPKPPSELRLEGSTLFVRLYDGYAAFPLIE